MKISFHKTARDPAVVHGLKIPYAPAKRVAAQWRWYVLLLVVSSPLLYFLVKLVLAWLVVGAQGFISLDKVAVNSLAAGIVERLPVQVGQTVTEGELIARLHNPEIASQQILNQAELAILKAGGPLSSSAGRERLLRQRLAMAWENLDAANDYLRNVSFLLEQGAATASELNLARERHNRSRMEYEQVRFELAQLQAAQHTAPGFSERETESRRMQIEARMAALSGEQKRLDQRAPCGGRVLDIMASEGETLSAGAPILMLGRAQKPFVAAYLPPKYARYARGGRSAVVTLPDGTVLPARVRGDANLTRRLPADLSSPIGSRDMMILVYLELEAPLPDIQWVDGLPVSVRFAFRLL